MRMSKQQGFTLVELLIALVLTALIMSLLFASLRITSRAWDSADRRQQDVAEQYQLQQLLRRLVGRAQSQRIRVDEGGVQVAFRGETDQLTFVAPRYASSSGGGLLWYRLRLSQATAERPEALVLETRQFDEDVVVDWALLFDPTYTVDEFNKTLPPPEEHLLRVTGDARLRFSYWYYEIGNVGQTRDEWLEEGTLPLMVELSLEELPAEDESASAQRPNGDLMSSWDALVIAMQEYNFEVRQDGL